MRRLRRLRRRECRLRRLQCRRDGPGRAAYVRKYDWDSYIPGFEPITQSLASRLMLDPC